MSTEVNLEEKIISDLKRENYFSITDNGVKTKIRNKLSIKYKVAAVWIKDVVINGYGKYGRKVSYEKIAEILGSPENDFEVIKTSEDPAEGTAKVKSIIIYFASSAPNQVGIGLWKILNSIVANNHKGLLIVNNGNDGPLADETFNNIKNTLDKFGIYCAGVYSEGISHMPKIDLENFAVTEKREPTLSLKEAIFLNKSPLSFKKYSEVKGYEFN